MTDNATVRRQLLAAGWRPYDPDLRRGRAYWRPHGHGTGLLHGEGYDGNPDPRENLPRSLTPAEAIERATAFAASVLAANHAHWARKAAATGRADDPAPTTGSTT
ncbi:hypothetical protein ACWDT6_30415 [Nocardia grenadensis]|uniref:hypothetical protein n=1 Tax=Embleya sp. NPDC005971 TaxID=3156724 RepID=UPI0034026B88